MKQTIEKHPKKIIKNFVDTETIFNNSIEIKTGNNFIKRLWLLLSNPFRYLFTGKIIY